jgi:3-oxosteroid 1-dehydrogenase
MTGEGMGAAPRGRLAREVVKFDQVADVVVIGSGAAGLAAAISAHDAGAEVLLIESQPDIGGTTRKSGAWYWIPNNSKMRGAGLDDPREQALRYMARISRPDRYDPDHQTLGLPGWEFQLISAFFDQASAVHDELERLGAISSVAPLDFPDYFAHLPEDQAPNGRVLVAAAPDGQEGNGDDMIRTMAAAAERAGVKTLRSCEVRQLILRANRTAGVTAEHEGATVAIGARRATVFASGGYAHNPRLRDELLAGPVFGTCAAPGSTGAFAEIATELGAPLRTTAYPWLAPCVLERALRGSPEFELTNQLPGDSMILVDAHGARVVNEKLQYNELGLAQWQWDGQSAQYPNLFLYMIWDEDCQRHFASDRPNCPIAPVGADDAHLIRGETLDELSAAIQSRLERLRGVGANRRLAEDFAQRLAETIDRYNQHARNGVDPDFRRGETPIELCFNKIYQEPRQTAGGNPTMQPLAQQGPWYATIIAPGALDTKGGPVTDAHGRVLGADGKPYPGLYGAGNCVASPSGRAYWAAGATIGPALTFGFLAGRSAANELPTDLRRTVAPTAAWR